MLKSKFKPMRIAIDIREIFGLRAGKGEYTYQILRGLLKYDRKNHYILYSNRTQGLRCKRDNLEIRQFKLKGLFWHLVVWLDVTLRTRPDIYFSPTSYVVPALGVRESVVMVPDLVSFLFPSQHKKKAVWIERAFLKMALRRAKKIIAISENTKRDLVRIFHVPSSKIKVVYLAANQHFRVINAQDPCLKNCRRKYGLPEKFVLFIGTLEPRKNLIRLIKSFQKISLPDCELVIGGRKGWYYQEIFQTVERLKLKDKVHFLGYVPASDLAPLYNLASVFVFPSLYEGFGLPPLEAMACGAAVIVGNASSLPEVVGSAALMVNPKSENEIAQALKKVLTDSSLRDKLGRLGVEQAQRFSWQKTVRKILDLFQELD